MTSRVWRILKTAVWNQLEFIYILSLKQLLQRHFKAQHYQQQPPAYLSLPPTYLTHIYENSKSTI